MLVIKLERWPKGEERRKVSLGTLEIVNDLKGTEEDGSYEVTLKIPGLDPMFAHVRSARGPQPIRAWRLLRRAIEQLGI
jgi:hypothetical protein